MAFLISCSKTKEQDEVYSAPEWAKGIVWYQIFPERFRNGDATNDPNKERARGPEGWAISEWTSDWYKRADWERNTSNDFYSTVRNRRYGGDLQGVIDKLDYLKELGIGAIYFNPVFDAQSEHKYDASYYHHIDRNFGPNPKADVRQIEHENPGNPDTWGWTSADSLFLKLIQEVHKRDMKLIVDGVFNHTGTDFWAFKDLIKNQEKSPYKDWYIATSFDDAATPDTNEFDYEGWWGYKGLPVYHEENETLVQPVREHIFAVTKRWMDPNGDGETSDGIDGWRLDVAEEVGKNFWVEWHSLVRSINPEAITVAEIWTDKAKEFINADMFTTVMNYRFAYAAKDFLIDESIDAEEFTKRLSQIKNDYPEEAEGVLQNLMESHDTPRLASMIVNPGREYDREAGVRDGYNPRKPNKEERQIQKLVALFQFTWKGAPMVYYGTEAGMWGADDPDDRKPMVWKDLSFEDETRHPYGENRPPDFNNFDSNLFNYYSVLANLRTNNEILKKGDASFIYINPEQKVVGFARTMQSKSPVFVFINRSNKSQSIRLDLKKFGLQKKDLMDLISGYSLPLPANGVLEYELLPVSGVIFQ